MKTERWHRIEALFDRAQGLPEAEREGFLDEACAGDARLRRELAALLAGAPTWKAAVRSAVIEEARLLASDVVAAQVGRRIGQFRLIRLVGEGGMGAVYLAARDDAQFDQRVAVKILLHALGSAAAIARFRDERQILAALEHPNIVRLFDGGSTDDALPYLVMEYVEGKTITRYADRGQLSVRSRVELVRQVCGALQYAHRHLVVHRDIKPSNILVNADGAPKILDFGIAKLLAPVARFQRKARTVTGVAMFTPEYASPEQVRGEAVSTATDIYAVGAVLYELVTGRPPQLRAGSALETLRMICEVEPPRPSAVAPNARCRELAGDLDNIILKALHKDPALRYPSMEQLSDDLGRWLDGLPVRARTPTLGYRAGKFVRRHRRGLVATVLVVGVLATAVTTSLHQASQIRTEQWTREQLQFSLDRALQKNEILERELIKVQQALGEAGKAAVDSERTREEALTLLEQALGSSKSTRAPDAGSSSATTSSSAR